MASARGIDREIAKASRRFRVKPRILNGMLMAESRKNPNIGGSPAGARDIAQFMPGTAKAMGVTLGDGRVTDDIHGAARYLRKLLDQFDGNYRLAVAAYNAGPGAVATYGGIPPYAETQAYVKKVMEDHSWRGGQLPARSGKRVRVRRGPGVPATTIPGEAKLNISEGVDNSQARARAVWRFLSRDNSDPLDFALEMKAAQDVEGDVSITQGADEVLPGLKGAPRPARGRQGATRGRKGVLQPRGRYAGTAGPMNALYEELARPLGLKATSRKRYNTNPASGSRSDHDYGNKDAYAIDMSDGSAPTPAMDEAAYRFAKRLGVKGYRKGQKLEATVNVRGVRYQLLYRTSTGGNHYNHLHVGAKRVGGTKGVLR